MADKSELNKHATQLPCDPKYGSNPQDHVLLRSSGVRISAGTGVRTLVPAGSLDQARSPAARTTTSSGPARAWELGFWVVNNAFIGPQAGMVRDSCAAMQDRLG
ncbi:uncharacterized protein ACHE_60027A [Aspergillus chevalieri]|uniref:Uncharacterized protein n=1 Tax=Aspergillus chevalieri TaxID=182096 RepID=A0A7R7ZQW8_ASPCH|nr:uncharacterized protein ACHE_60027A [Aspergillus chevalieri]BCR90141.1 hypothetical protein ACHE_60027A [Aspergillus chevalieri]